MNEDFKLTMINQPRKDKQYKISLGKTPGIVKLRRVKWNRGHWELQEQGKGHCSLLVRDARRGGTPLEYGRLEE